MGTGDGEGKIGWVGDLSFSEPGSLCMGCNDALYLIFTKDWVSYDR